jgi:hypothetical protein
MAERGIVPLEPTVQTYSRFVYFDTYRRAHITTRTNQSPANSAATDSTTEATI